MFLILFSILILFAMFLLNNPLFYIAVLVGAGVLWWMPKLLVENVSIIYDDVLFSKRNGHAGKRENKTIYLTIDDAPYTTESFRNILETLNKFNLKASFFVISGNQNEENDKLLVSALQQGHKLFNHGRTDSAHALKNPKELEEEIDHCEEYLSNLYHTSGVDRPEVLYYRPGCGFISRTMREIIRRKGMKLVLGNVYPHDPMIRSPTINEWYLKNHIEVDDIIIIHDRVWTVPLLEKIGGWLRDNFETKTLDE